MALPAQNYMSNNSRTEGEMKVALEHLSGAGAFTVRDFQMMMYGLGRGLLWLVVFSAIWSMYGYFKHFFLNARARSRAKLEAAKEPAIAP